MDNRIREIAVVDHRLDFAESEVRIVVQVDRVTPATEVKGRLMGPSSAYTSTVEVAHHWHEVSRTDDHILLRAVLPEPCFWEPHKAFLYHGPVELWQHGRRVDQKRVTHALRQVRIGAEELRINGKTIPRRAAERPPASESEARALHDRGVNAIVVAEPTAELRELADRYGLVLVR